MPSIDVYNVEGKKVSSVDLKEEIFGIEPNEALVHSVLVNYLANQRQGTQSTKTRSEVRGDEGENVVESEIDASRLDMANEWHEKLVEMVAGADDSLMEIYLEGGEISVEQLKKAIREGTINRSYVPFIMGSARHNQGVQPLIDAVVDYLPCPTDVPAAKGIKIKKDQQEDVEVPCDATKMPLGLVFKIQYDREMGPLCYVRMYSGKIPSGTQIFNIYIKRNS